MMAKPKFKSGSLKMENRMCYRLNGIKVDGSGYKTGLQVAPIHLDKGERKQIPFSLCEHKGSI